MPCGGARGSVSACVDHAPFELFRPHVGDGVHKIIVIS
jgi:hypothetical protein